MTTNKSTKGVFTCNICKSEFPYEYFGTKPPFHPRVIFLEEVYAMKDPFTPEPKPLCLGSLCSLCQSSVCVSPKCSLFYTKRFCFQCVKDNLEEFPDQIQKEYLKKS